MTKNSAFSPNMHVYRLVRRALGMEISQEECEALWGQVVQNELDEDEN